jgi:hypothetical protein
MAGYGSGDDVDYDDPGCTRDFFSQPPGYDVAGSSTYPMEGSSSLSTTRLDFGPLDLNSNAGWSEMQSYQQLLQTGVAAASQPAAPVAPPEPAPRRSSAGAGRGRGRRAVPPGGCAASAVPGAGSAGSAIPSGGSGVHAAAYAGMAGGYPSVPPGYPYPPMVPWYPPVPPAYPPYMPGAPTAPVPATSAPAGGGHRGGRRRVGVKFFSQFVLPYVRCSHFVAIMLGIHFLPHCTSWTRLSSLGVAGAQKIQKPFASYTSHT